MSAGAAAVKSQFTLDEGRRIRDAGGRVVAIMGWRVPIEPVRAAGFHAIQVSADPAMPTPDADELLSAEAKPPVRAVLQLVLSGALDFAELIVFAPPFAPVSVLVEELRRMALVAESVPPTFYFETAMWRGDLQRDFAIRRTRDLAQRLASLAGQPMTDAALETEIVASNKARRAAWTLLATRDEDDGPRGSTVVTALGESDWLAPDEYAARLEAVAAEREETTGGPRLMLVSSSVLGDARVHALAEDAGATIISEDDIYGSCYAIGEIEEGSGDPLAAIGNYYHDNQPLQRTAPQQLRRSWYREQVRREDIDGVIFYAEDPIWGWDVPAMRAAAAEAGKATTTLMRDVRLPEQGAAAAKQLAEFVETLARESTT